jgi:hypothetical protein
MTPGAARVTALFLLLAGLLAPWTASAADDKDKEPEAFARVVSDSAELRTGPGVSYRVIYVAHRGETLALDGRPSAGFWLRVVLPDGRTAYALGDEVQPFAVEPGEPGAPARPGFLAPPPLEGSRAGLALVTGMLSIPVVGLGIQRYGYVEARPSILIHKTLSVEAFVGDALTGDGAQLLYGAGLSIYLAPSWPICPFVGLAAGGLSVFPNPDSFVLHREDMYVARAGGGILLALRNRILVRIEATNLSLFTGGAALASQMGHGAQVTEANYRNAQTYSGGLGVYF